MKNRGVTSRSDYWCECTTFAPGSGEAAELVGSFDADSVSQALAWIRVAVREIAPALAREAAEAAQEWMASGCRSTRQALMSGQAEALTITHGDTVITWAVRRVQFLPWAHRAGDRLPECADRFTATPIKHLKTDRTEPASE